MTEGTGGGGTGPHTLPEFQVTPLDHSAITQPSGERLKNKPPAAAVRGGDSRLKMDG